MTVVHTDGLDWSWRPRAWRSRLANGLAPLGRPSAFSWPVIAIYLPLLIASQLTSDARSLGGTLASWSISVLVSSVAFIVAFLAVRAMVMRRGNPSPFTVLAAYAVAGLVRALVAGYSLTVLGATDHPYFSYRLVGVLYNTTLLGIIGYGVGRHDMHRTVVTALHQQRRQLRTLEQRLDEALERTRIELTTAVRVSIEPLVRAVDSALTIAAAGAGPIPALQALERLIDEKVRPLSRQLAEEEAPVLEVDAPSSTRASTRVPLPSRFRIRDAIRPFLVAGLAWVIGIPLAVRDLAFPQFIPYMLTVPLAAWVTLALARCVLGRLVLPTPIGIGLVVALHAGTGLVVSTLLNVLGIPAPRAVQPMASILFGLIGAVVVGSLLVEARRSATEADLAAVNVQLEETITLLRRRSRLIRRRLARVMHGSLQGELYAAAIRLQSSPTPSASLVEEVRSDVASALRHLDGEAPRLGRTEAAIAAIVETWRGIREIRVSLGLDVAPALDGDPDADDAVADVVREAVNNAIRHGDAAVVEIDVNTTGSTVGRERRSIAVVVRDDGSPWADDARHGQGTALFDELCSTWSHVSEGRWTSFRGDIPRTE